MLTFTRLTNAGSADCRFRPPPGSAAPPIVLAVGVAGAAVLAPRGALAIARAARAAPPTIPSRSISSTRTSTPWSRRSSEITGRNFMLDPRIKGTVNIISARPGAEEPRLPDAVVGAALAGLRGGRRRRRHQARPRSRSEAAGQRRSAQGRSRRGRRPAGDAGDHAAATSRRTQIVNVLRPLITPNNTIAAFPGSQRAGHHRLRGEPAADREDHRVARPAAGGRADARPAASTRPRSTSSRSSIALARTESRHAPARRRTMQQRVTARRRSALEQRAAARRTIPRALARVRALIEQLDTPGRAGGNMFIVYLKNADAARVAQTLRALLPGGSDAARRGGIAAVADRQSPRSRSASPATPRRRRRKPPRDGRLRRSRSGSAAPAAFAAAARRSRPTPRTTR